jgi:hypothetical protein
MAHGDSSKEKRSTAILDSLLVKGEVVNWLSMRVMSGEEFCKESCSVCSDSRMLRVLFSHITGRQSSKWGRKEGRVEALTWWFPSQLWPTIAEIQLFDSFVMSAELTKIEDTSVRNEIASEPKRVNGRMSSESLDKFLDAIVSDLVVVEHDVLDQGVGVEILRDDVKQLIINTFTTQPKTN